MYSPPRQCWSTSQPATSSGTAEQFGSNIWLPWMNSSASGASVSASQTVTNGAGSALQPLQRSWLLSSRCQGDAPVTIPVLAHTSASRMRTAMPPRAEDAKDARGPSLIKDRRAPLVSHRECSQLRPCDMEWCTTWRLTISRACFSGSRPGMKATPSSSYAKRSDQLSSRAGRAPRVDARPAGSSTGAPWRSAYGAVQTSTFHLNQAPITQIDSVMQVVPLLQQRMPASGTTAHGATA
mmetsp:Transcript_52749/g.163342  ORF Transcript_52749/g.163342 Transcript_52749/m.163342 type:complete len:238 (+) Transcript_52749:502-1215(+)